jgi:hypothetical protein
MNCEQFPASIKLPQSLHQTVLLVLEALHLGCGLPLSSTTDRVWHWLDHQA